MKVPLPDQFRNIDKLPLIGSRSVFQIFTFIMFLLCLGTWIGTFIYQKHQTILETRVAGAKLDGVFLDTLAQLEGGFNWMKKRKQTRICWVWNTWYHIMRYIDCPVFCELHMSRFFDFILVHLWLRKLYQKKGLDLYFLQICRFKTSWCLFDDIFRNFSEKPIAMKFLTFFEKVVNFWLSNF